MEELNFEDRNQLADLVIDLKSRLGGVKERIQHMESLYKKFHEIAVKMKSKKMLEEAKQMRKEIDTLKSLFET